MKSITGWVYCGKISPRLSELEVFAYMCTDCERKTYVIHYEDTITECKFCPSCGKPKNIKPKFDLDDYVRRSEN